MIFPGASVMEWRVDCKRDLANQGGIGAASNQVKLSCMATEPTAKRGMAVNIIEL